MPPTKTAYFVFRPGKVSDLKKLHLASDEQPYTIMETKKLSRIDYENFSEDLLVYRKYLDGIYYGPTSDIHKCLLITQQASPSEGILVEPTGDGNVKFAAYISNL